MLVHLSIRDFAIIDALDLPFSGGMTVLTGETGAGKSILIDALVLLLGGRASAEVIRTGSDEAIIGGQFSLSGTLLEQTNMHLTTHGLPVCEDGALILRRVVNRAGRHKQFVNGIVCTVSQLRSIAAPLLDMTGQHAHQALLRLGAQLDTVDNFGNCIGKRQNFQKLFVQAQAVVRERDHLRSLERDKQNRADWLRFQLDEIVKMKLSPNEEEQLLKDRVRLQSAGSLRDAVTKALAYLTDGGDALSRVQSAAQVLSRNSKADEGFEKMSSVLQDAAALIDDVSRTLSRMEDSYNDDPGRLTEIEDRLNAIRRVCRKHGGGIAQVLAAAEKMEEELDKIERTEEHVEALNHKLHTLLLQMATIADELSVMRIQAGEKLTRSIEAELKDLGMAKARLSVRVEPISAGQEDAMALGEDDDKRSFVSTGGDKVELYMSANAGEEMRPLAKVASGGELSRVLLSLKRVLLANDPVPVSIFDEVDSGVGGAIGEAIGEKLAAIAMGRQVLCITHLAQIAARAKQHWRVEKNTEVTTQKERTVSRVRILSDEDRIIELARMLGGRDITAATTQYAAELFYKGKNTNNKNTNDEKNDEKSDGKNVGEKNTSEKNTENFSVAAAAATVH